MAATCPKCGGKLRLIDWKPNCPHCGVNMVYYGMEERLLLDADRAEAEHAKFQPKVDRLKAAFVGSPLTIARIVCSALPIAGLFLPLAKFAFQAPYAAFDGSANVISVYNLISGMDFGALSTMMSSELFGTAFTLYTIALGCVLLSALGVLLHLILLMLSCSPKGKLRNYGFDITNLILVGGAIGTFAVFSAKIRALFPGIVKTSAVGFGAYIYLALLVICFVADILCFVKGVEVKYKPCFVGNIPAEEYFRLVEEGVPIEKIRAVMAEHTMAKEAEEAKKKAEEEEKKKAEEAAQAEAASQEAAQEEAAPEEEKETANAT